MQLCCNQETIARGTPPDLQWKSPARLLCLFSHINVFTFRFLFVASANKQDRIFAWVFFFVKRTSLHQRKRIFLVWDPWEQRHSRGKWRPLWLLDEIDAWPRARATFFEPGRRRGDPHGDPQAGDIVDRQERLSLLRHRWPHRCHPDAGGPAKVPRRLDRSPSTPANKT